MIKDYEGVVFQVGLSILPVVSENVISVQKTDFLDHKSPPSPALNQLSKNPGDIPLCLHCLSIK